MASYAINEQYHGIEITFDSKPSRAVLDGLKAHGFRWHNARRLWYAKQTESRLSYVRSILDTATATDAPKQAKKRATEAHAAANKYGVKVGDLFYTSWGYDQTNVDFFQVVALCGASSVRVREVYPRSRNVSAWSDGSTVDEYQNTGELLDAAPHSVFIKDQTNGDLKRLKSYAADGVSNPQFTLSSFADAYYVEGQTITLREDHGYR